MRHLLFVPCCVVLMLAGCSTSETKVQTHPVSGKIFYDGKPAAGVNVYFLPTSAPTVPQVPSNPHGVTQADGSFQLETYGNQDGAAEGGYQIMLTWPTPSEGDSEISEDRLLGWYTPAHSNLTYIVKSGFNIVPDIKINAIRHAPAEIQGIPGKN